MAKYRKKPVVVEAVQWTGENKDEVADFFGSDLSMGLDFGFYEMPEPHWSIFTLEGVMGLFLSNWLIKGIAGEFYPVKPDIFEATYDEVDRYLADVGGSLTR